MTDEGSLADVAGILIGHWTDPVGLTGCTVVLCPPGTVGSGEVRGGAPGTRETDLLRPGMLVDEVHAVLVTGGSAFGLAAADGVVTFLEEKLQPQGAMVVIEARHLCVEMRGVKKPGAQTVTSALRGIFHQRQVREEFLDLLRHG